MRIVNREEFLKMPEGTVYALYEHCIFGDLAIKGESLENDWYYQQIADAVDCDSSIEWAEKLFQSESAGTNIDMDFDCQGRDGCFEDEQLFSVWSKEDVNKLITRLQVANNG